MLGNVTLHEHDRPIRVKAGREQLCFGYPGASAQVRGVLRHSDRVQVNHAVHGVVRLLKCHRLAYGTEVVADMERLGGRLDAGEHAWSGHGPKSSPGLTRPGRAAQRRSLSSR